MAINLIKGQTVDLRKNIYDLDQITLGLGWKVREQRRDFICSLLDDVSVSTTYDLDAIAFLLDEHGKVRHRGDEKLEGGDIVFFNSRAHPSGMVTHSGDNRSGGTGESDDEQIVVRLNAMPAQYHRILFLVCIYNGIANKQHFGQIERAYIRAVDAQGQEMARYDLGADPAHEGQCTLVFGEVSRRPRGWSFRAIGEPHAYDSFVPLLLQHLPSSEEQA